MVRPRFITAHILLSNFDALQGVGELADVVFGVLPDEFVLGLDEVEVISAAQGGCFDKVDGVLLADLDGANALFGQAADSETLFALCIAAAFVDEIHFGIRPGRADAVDIFIDLAVVLVIPVAELCRSKATAQNIPRHTGQKVMIFMLCFDMGEVSRIAVLRFVLEIGHAGNDFRVDRVKFHLHRFHRRCGARGLPSF